MCMCTSRRVYIPTRTYQWTVYAGVTVKLQGVSVILLQTSLTVTVVCNIIIIIIVIISVSHSILEAGWATRFDFGVNIKERGGV